MRREMLTAHESQLLAGFEFSEPTKRVLCAFPRGILRGMNTNTQKSWLRLCTGGWRRGLVHARPGSGHCPGGASSCTDVSPSLVPRRLVGPRLGPVPELEQLP
jgi:hypothetical protein